MTDKQWLANVGIDLDAIDSIDELSDSQMFEFVKFWEIRHRHDGDFRQATLLTRKVKENLIKKWEAENLDEEKIASRKQEFDEGTVTLGEIINRENWAGALAPHYTAPLLTRKEIREYYKKHPVRRALTWPFRAIGISFFPTKRYELRWGKNYQVVEHQREE